jgi:spore germination protein YaaH
MRPPILAAILALSPLARAEPEGPHAREAALHAQDPVPEWVPAPPAQRTQLAAARPPLFKRVYGYVPYWVTLDLAAFHWELVSDVIAFSVEIATDGTVPNPRSLPKAALVQAAHANGAKVHLAATLFNTSGGSEIATFLGSSAATAQATQQLASLAQGLDGINLDFEFVPSASRDAFTAFVRQLHAALPAGSELTLAMPASVRYAGYDVPNLAVAAQRLLLMEYDYHWRLSPTAGANSPLAAVETAVNGFLGQASAASIAMGVPYYGYDWPTATASPGSNTSAGGTTVLFRDVFAKFAVYGRLWDSASQTPWYQYSAGAQQRQGWVDDDQSLALKFSLVNQKALAGVMIWALGYDSGRAEAWDALRTAFGQEPPPPPPHAHGCSQAGATPAWLVLAAALAAGAARRRGAC